MVHFYTPKTWIFFAVRIREFFFGVVTFGKMKLGIWDVRRVETWPFNGDCQVFLYQYMYVQYTYILYILTKFGRVENICIFSRKFFPTLYKAEGMPYKWTESWEFRVFGDAFFHIQIFTCSYSVSLYEKIKHPMVSLLRMKIKMETSLDQVYSVVRRCTLYTVPCTLYAVHAPIRAKKRPDRFL